MFFFVFPAMLSFNSSMVCLVFAIFLIALLNSFSSLFSEFNNGLICLYHFVSSVDASSHFADFVTFPVFGTHRNTKHRLFQIHHGNHGIEHGASGGTSRNPFPVFCRTSPPYTTDTSPCFRWIIRASAWVIVLRKYFFWKS